MTKQMTSFKNTFQKTLESFKLIKMEKKFYTISAIWQMCANTIVEAESLEEALIKVYEAPLPTDAEYLVGSFEIDRTNLEEGEYKQEWETIKDNF